MNSELQLLKQCAVQIGKCQDWLQRIEGVNVSEVLEDLDSVKDRIHDRIKTVALRESAA